MPINFQKAENKVTKLQIKASSKVLSLLPGFLLATAIAVVAEGVHGMIVVGGEKPVSGVIIAIIIGALISNSFKIQAQIAPGVNYIMSKVLKAAIILLGLSLSFMAVIKTGALALVVIVITVTLAIILTYRIGNKLGLPDKLAALIAIGTAICGATAIVSTAPVIEAEDEDITYAVATITIFGIIAIFIYPVLGKLMLFSDLQFGTWAGVAIHETAQVVAAGFAFSPEAGEIATVVKLTRTVLLAPLVLIVGAIYARRNQGQCGEINCLKIFPWFVVGFLLMAGLRTMGDNLWLNDAIWQTVLSFGKAASKQLIVLAMAAVGLKTSLQTMKQIGGIKPFVVGLIASITMAVLSLLIILVMRI